MFLMSYFYQSYPNIARESWGNIGQRFKIKNIHFCIKLGILHHLRHFLHYAAKFQDSKLIKTSVWK